MMLQAISHFVWVYQRKAGLEAAFWPLLQAVPPLPFGRPAWIDTAIPNSELGRSKRSLNVPAGQSLTKAFAGKRRPLSV
jgi:hypothetical protein